MNEDDVHPADAAHRGHQSGKAQPVSGAEARGGVASQWEHVRMRLKAELGEARYKSWISQLTLIGVGDRQVTFSVPTLFIRDWIQTQFGERLLGLWQLEDPSIERVTMLPEGTARAAVPAAGAARPMSEAMQAEMAVAGVGGTRTHAGLSSARPVTASSGSHRPGTPPHTTQQSGSATFTGETAPRHGGGTGGAGGSGGGTGGFGGQPNNQPGTQSGGEEALGAPLHPHLTFDSFVVGKSNQLAYAAARRVAEAEGTVPFNPLYLYGPVGLGKTHLMHAIGWEIRRRDPSKKVVYLSAEKFMYHFVSALRFKDTVAFKQQFRSVDVLMIDDVQFIGGKDSTQEEFFHTFNALVEHNRQIVISADRSPSDLEGIEERIRSRLGSGLACDILPTDYELRLGILQTKGELMLKEHPGVNLPQDVLEFLAQSVASNIRELEGALTRLVAHAALVGRTLSVPMAQELLRDLVRANEKRITIDDIQRTVADYYNLRLSDMASPRRARSVARPRQIAMWLCKSLTTNSLPAIGRKFGGRDHTTVMHAVRQIDKLRATDKALDEDVEVLRRMLEG